jgi:HAT1-interacting factor 1
MTASKEKLAELTSLKARALKAYATKDFPTSADLYGHACQLQTEIHGEDNPNNAQLLYLYGRSLYRVAIEKSDVLGGASEKKDKEEEKEETPAASSNKGKGIAPVAKPKGVFSFQGDGDYDESDEESEEGEGEEEEREEEDEMGAAWEVLDFARVLFEKQLDAQKNPPAESPPTPMTDDQLKDTKTMLADVYDLLGEVSLESENFPQATKDFDSALELKTELYPIESTIRAEAEFKLALALEFSAGDDGMSKEDSTKLREAAADHIEKAITSCRARLETEEKRLAAAAEDNKGKGKAVETKESKENEDVKSMIAELEQRKQDLLNPPEENPEKEELAGLLGQILNDADPAAAKEALEKAVQNANDLTSLVKKKKKPEEPVAGPSKRKLDDIVEEDTSKKAKVEETTDGGL